MVAQTPLAVLKDPLADIQLFYRLR
jgi:hypothetical protein